MRTIGTEEIAAIRAVIVYMEFLVTRQQGCVPRGVLLAMKASIVTKVNSKIIVELEFFFRIIMSFYSFTNVRKMCLKKV